MSDKPNTYTFDTGRYLDLNKDDFKELCPDDCDSTKLMEDVRHRLSEFQGKWNLIFQKGGIECVQEGREIVFFPYTPEPTVKPDDTAGETEVSPYKAQNAEYGLQLKVNVSGDYDGKETIKYRVEPQGGINHKEPWEEPVKDIFSDAISLDVFVKYLSEHFSLTSSDLIETLAKLDLGTTMIDLAAEPATGKYKIQRIYQAQAHSFSKQKISKLIADKESLDSKIKNLEKEKAILENKLKRFEQLEKVEKEHKSLLEKLGLQYSQDVQVSQFAQIRKKTSLISSLSPKMTGDIQKRLSSLSSDSNKLNELLDRIKDIISDYIEDVATDEELEVLSQDITNVPEKLSAKVRDAVSSHLLYHFSAPESRQADRVNRYRSLMKQYEMDFIGFNPGDPVTSKECRFVKVIESQYPRGTCVETQAWGVKDLSNGYIIYKADVVISK